MRARNTGVLQFAGATALVVLLAACGGPAAKSAAIGGTQPSVDPSSSSAPTASTAPSAGRSASAKPSQSSAPKASSSATSRPVNSGGSHTPSSAAPVATSGSTTQGMTVSTKCRKPATSVGSGQALPHLTPPGFTSTRTDCNGTLDFASYTNGKPTLVTFFASWCEPCHQEAKDLEAVYQEHHDSGFQIIAVDTQDESGSPTWFYNTAKWSFPAVWDDGEKIEKAWNTSGVLSTLPGSFWIHPDGTISKIESGKMTRSTMETDYNSL